MDDGVNSDNLNSATKKAGRGRPRSSPMQQAATLERRKQLYWGAAHNAKRRAQYANDPEYAERMRAKRREQHARKNAQALTNVTCAGNLSKVEGSGLMVAVRYNGSAFAIGRVFTLAGLALMLNQQSQVIYRWHRCGNIPSPVLIDARGDRYFADEEVRRFVAIMAVHQVENRHYRSDHYDIRARLFDAAFINHPDQATAWVSARAE